MPDQITWDDADEIADVLRRRFPDSDPATVSDLEIARWTREIPTLVGEPAHGGAAAQVAAIRAAWVAG
ncbi:MAG TPA: Fe-S cluster assembly protein IscX [Terriglobales bacterium]|nr:Fe-S cluster assembly protein IscX [Terriglobales bacterium]